MKRIIQPIISLALSLLPFDDPPLVCLHLLVIIHIDILTFGLLQLLYALPVLIAALVPTQLGVVVGHRAGLHVERLLQVAMWRVNHLAARQLASGDGVILADLHHVVHRVRGQVVDGDARHGVGVPEAEVDVGGRQSLDVEPAKKKNQDQGCKCGKKSAFWKQIRGPLPM